VAVALTGDRRARAFQTMDALPMYEEMIVTGAWWDYVDVLAKPLLPEARDHGHRDPGPLPPGKLTRQPPPQATMPRRNTA